MRQWLWPVQDNNRRDVVTQTHDGEQSLLPAQPLWLRTQVPESERVPPLCWPFPPGSQNHTDKAVKLKPYVPPKRRSLNQY